MLKNGFPPLRRWSSARYSRLGSAATIRRTRAEVASRSRPDNGKRRTPAMLPRIPESSLDVIRTSSRWPATIPARNSSRSSEPGSAQCASSKITSSARARVVASITSATAANNSGRDANRPGSSSSAVPRRLFSTCVHGQYDGMSADEQRPHATPNRSSRAIASTASLRLVFPMPASPVMSATRPRPASASSTSSASAVSSGSRPSSRASIPTSPSSRVTNSSAGTGHNAGSGLRLPAQ